MKEPNKKSIPRKSLKDDTEKYINKRLEREWYLDRIRRLKERLQKIKERGKKHE